MDRKRLISTNMKSYLSRVSSYFYKTAEESSTFFNLWIRVFSFTVCLVALLINKKNKPISHDDDETIIKEI